jgi:hypothetical protein
MSGGESLGGVDVACKQINIKKFQAKAAHFLRSAVFDCQLRNWNIFLRQFIIKVPLKVPGTSVR